MKNDYRLTKYGKEFDGILSNKIKLKQKIKYETGNENIYNVLKKKGTRYNREFFKIYNCKCAYCGSSNKNLNYTTEFEIDHFINKASFSKEIEVNGIENLISSCYYCNRGKSCFTINDNLSKLLNPDDGSIAKVFERDDMYNIKIREEYQDNQEIQKFYKKLRLGNEFRRLDYLLMCMKEFVEVIDDEGIKSKLFEIIFLLQEKSNNTYKMKKVKVNS